MQIAFKVLSESTREGVSKKTGEPYKMTTVKLFDNDGTCSTVFEMTLQKRDEDQRGKLRGTEILVDVEEVKPPFNGAGCIEVRGAIVRD